MILKIKAFCSPALITAWILPPFFCVPSPSCNQSKERRNISSWSISSEWMKKHVKKQKQLCVTRRIPSSNSNFLANEEWEGADRQEMEVDDEDDDDMMEQLDFMQQPSANRGLADALALLRDSGNLTYSLTHLLDDSLIHSLIHSLTLSFTYLLTHLLTYSLTHSFTHSQAPWIKKKI